MNKNVKQINTKKSHPTENAIIDTKNDFIAWIKTHKKQLILASIGITTIIGTILVFRIMIYLRYRIHSTKNL